MESGWGSTNRNSETTPHCGHVASFPRGLGTRLDYMQSDTCTTWMELGSRSQDLYPSSHVRAKLVSAVGSNKTMHTMYSTVPLPCIIQCIFQHAFLYTCMYIIHTPKHLVLRARLSHPGWPARQAKHTSKQRGMRKEHVNYS